MKSRTALEIAKNVVEERRRLIAQSVQTGRHSTKKARIDGVQEGGFAVIRALVEAGAFAGDDPTMVHLVIGDGRTACGLPRVPTGADFAGPARRDLVTCAGCRQNSR